MINKASKQVTTKIPRKYTSSAVKKSEKEKKLILTPKEDWTRMVIMVV